MLKLYVDIYLINGAVSAKNFITFAEFCSNIFLYQVGNKFFKCNKMLVSDTTILKNKDGILILNIFYLRIPAHLWEGTYNNLNLIV